MLLGTPFLTIPAGIDQEDLEISCNNECAMEEEDKITSQIFVELNIPWHDPWISMFDINVSKFTIPAGIDPGDLENGYDQTSHSSAPGSYQQLMGSREIIDGLHALAYSGMLFTLSTFKISRYDCLSDFAVILQAVMISAWVLRSPMRKLAM